MITWNTDVNAPGCIGEIVGDEGQSLLIQTDWDYPGIASTFGWNIASVQKASPRRDFDFKAECGISICDDCGFPLYPMELEENECPECGGKCSPFSPCDHKGTDGTVNCSCGLTPRDFIASAADYLRENDGATANDTGYFGND